MGKNLCCDVAAAAAAAAAAALMRAYMFNTMTTETP